jgi:hypothetical protein
MLAHHARLHDALAIDHTTQPTLPGGQHNGVRKSPQVKLADRGGFQLFIVGQHQGHRRIKLPKPAHHPIRASGLVVPGNAHGLKQLNRNGHLPFAMVPLVCLFHRKVTLVGNAFHHVFGIALAYALQRLPGDHMHIPGLGVHRRGRPLGHLDDVVNQVARDGFRQITSDAGAGFDEGGKVHGSDDLNRNDRARSWMQTCPSASRLRRLSAKIMGGLRSATLGHHGFRDLTRGCTGQA